MRWFITDALAVDTPTVATDTGVSEPAAPYEISAEKMMMDNFLILGMMLFIFYFILIRPQQKRVKAHQKMIKELKKGSKVMTNGGLYGVITKFDGDDIVHLEIAQGTVVRVARVAISDVISDTGAGVANDN